VACNLSLKKKVASKISGKKKLPEFLVGEETFRFLRMDQCGNVSLGFIVKGVLVKEAI
jgi:hypothetical protein